MFAAAGQEMAAQAGEQRDDDPDHADSRNQRRGSPIQQRSDARSTGDATDTEHAVKSGHQRAATRALDDDRLGVHCDIDRADAGTEHHQPEGERGGTSGVGQEGQRRTDQDRCGGDNDTATQAIGQNAGQWHGGERARSKAKQQQTECRVVETGAILGEGDKWCPSGESKTGDEEGGTGGGVVPAIWNQT